MRIKIYLSNSPKPLSHHLDWRVDCKRDALHIPYARDTATKPGLSVDRDEVVTQAGATTARKVSS